MPYVLWTIKSHNFSLTVEVIFQSFLIITVCMHISIHILRYKDKQAKEIEI